MKTVISPGKTRGERLLWISLACLVPLIVAFSLRPKNAADGPPATRAPGLFRGSQNSDRDALFAHSLLASAGYSRDYAGATWGSEERPDSGELSGSANYRNQLRARKVKFRVSLLPDIDRAVVPRPGDFNQLPSLEYDKPLSGVPFGEASVNIESDASLSIVAGYRQFSCKAWFEEIAGSTKSGHSARGVLNPTDGERAMLERAVREVLSRTVGVALAPAGTVKVEGSDVARFGFTPEAPTHLDLEQWCRAKGSGRREGPGGWRLHISRGGREYEIALGCAHVNVAGSWRDLGGCVALKDGRWLVPAALDGLVP